MFFSAMGFYPVCPATDEYVLGTPLFNQIDITLENGKKLNILAPSNSAQHKFVKELKWNNKLYNFNYVKHSELLKGGTLNFTMSDKPETKRGISSKCYPYSVSLKR